MESLGIPLLAFTVLALLTAGVVGALALLRGPTRSVRTLALLCGAWLGAYATVLIVTSLGSRERTLALGETKRFCGFYLDCHMGVAVVRVDTTSSIGAAGKEIRAGGTFYVVTLRVSNNAQRVPLRLEEPRITIVDAEGFRYERSLDAEHALASGPLVNLERPVDAGHSFTRVIVVDVPHAVREPRLHVTMGGPLDRAAELALIGDDDAVLHARTLHALAQGSGVSSASARLR